MPMSCIHVKQKRYNDAKDVYGRQRIIYKSVFYLHNWFSIPLITLDQLIN